MSERGILYSRDLLYPTDSLFEPGSVHIEITDPNKKDRIPVIIEGKSSHSPVKYMSSIIRIMQSDIFDRIFVNIKQNVSLYIRTDEEIRKKYGSSNYLLAVFDGDNISFEGVDNIEA